MAISSQDHALCQVLLCLCDPGLWAHAPEEEQLAIGKEMESSERVSSWSWKAHIFGEFAFKTFDLFWWKQCTAFALDLPRIIYRDLKPENLLLTEEGQLKAKWSGKGKEVCRRISNFQPVLKSLESHSLFVTQIYEWVDSPGALKRYGTLQRTKNHKTQTALIFLDHAVSSQPLMFATTSNSWRSPWMALKHMLQDRLLLIFPFASRAFRILDHPGLCRSQIWAWPNLSSVRRTLLVALQMLGPMNSRIACCGVCSGFEPKMNAVWPFVQDHLAISIYWV